MRKLSRLLGATGIFALAIGLSGCATVSVKAAVLDDTNALIAVQQVITQEGFISYLESKPGDSGATSTGSSEDEQAPDLTGVWNQVPIEGSEIQNQQLVITPERVTVYQNDKDLFWAGSYDAPKIESLNYDWESEWFGEESKNFAYKVSDVITFNWDGNKISYVIKDSFSQDTRVTFEKESAAPPVDETPTAAPSAVPTDPEELCTLFKSEVGNFLELPTGIQAAVECTDVDYAVTVEYPVAYTYAGVTQIAGADASKADVALLPFRLYLDPVYGDVVFEHKVMGLDRPEFRAVADWVKAVTDYRVSVSFPGDITDVSNEGVQDTANSVYWDYALVKASVESGDYTLSVAGRADAKVDPIPIIVTIVGILFLLLLLVYFMWKRFTPRTIAITSFILTPLSPFGLALALVARKKARNDADGGKLAFIAVIVTSAAFVFEALILILLLIMAPQLVNEILSEFGLVSSSA